MIARLRGTLDTLGEDHAVIDVGGVGYLVACPTRTLAALPRPGEAVDLLIETQVRDDSITLYGFRSGAERSWFRLLQTVQGVGARVALAILSVLGPDELARAVAAQDKAALARASGVGPRLAGRIASELNGSPDRAARPGRRPDARARRRDARRARRRCGLGLDQSRLRPQRGPRRGRQGRRHARHLRRRSQSLIRTGLQELATRRKFQLRRARRLALVSPAASCLSSVVRFRIGPD